MSVDPRHQRPRDYRLHARRDGLPARDAPGIQTQPVSPAVLSGWLLLTGFSPVIDKKTGRHKCISNDRSCCWCCQGTGQVDEDGYYAWEKEEEFFGRLEK